jgi:rubrerythrin
VGIISYMVSVDEAIEYAIAQENKAFGFYRTWGEKASDAEVKTIFLNLASMEKSHIRLLNQVLRMKDKNFYFTSTYSTDITYGITHQPSSRTKDLVRIFEYAIHKEKEAQDNYVKLAKAVSDEKVKKLFQKLSDEEKYHKTLLDQQFTRFLKAL